MINYLFPSFIDNEYKGKKVPLFFFYLVTPYTIVRSFIHLFLPDGGAQSIATIPLHLYSTNASDTIIHLFSEWGLSQLLFGLLYIIVLIKYKSLIPLMYLFLVIEYSTRLLLGFYKPLELEGYAPGGIGNYILVPLFMVMFILSIKNNRQ
jgi:hypothetical protein